ncbi:hypothetical protein H5410_023797 [Solanum commersonii]|uniref:Uncharacterized protein n=2 Tax=Solanum TaxID=4107 RepID=M1CMV6_SOLTU|nr:hypothetical protein H5410_023795 [Solanum commersonii]KAG5612516.1 hypothetical protein H5410_023797 [Solanum commersonii]
MELSKISCSLRLLNEQRVKRKASGHWGPGIKDDFLECNSIFQEVPNKFNMSCTAIKPPQLDHFEVMQSTFYGGLPTLSNSLDGTSRYQLPDTYNKQT